MINRESKLSLADIRSARPIGGGLRMRGAPCLAVTLFALLAACGLAEGHTGSATRLGIDGAHFTINGRPAFLFGVSYYGALGAPDEIVQRDLAELRKQGFNWIRVWATWAAFGNDVSVVDGEGKPRELYLKRLQRLVAACDEQGIVVDVTLSRGNGATGPARLQTQEAHRGAVTTLLAALKGHRNWYLDLANERNIQDRRFTSFADLKELRELVCRIDPDRLVTASHAGDLSRDELREYLLTVGVDILSPHRPRSSTSPGETAARSREDRDWMKELGREVPLHYQEPFRRGFGGWQPRAPDYVADLQGALAGGAAGWCWHNGANRAAREGRPRRSFDLRDRGLFEQLDQEEARAIPLLARVIAEARDRNIREAVGKALPLIRKGSDGHMAKRTCFACHHQAVPLLALTTARSRGFPVEQPALQKHLRFIADFLDENREQYRKGRGQGGQVTTAGYALWSLELGGWRPDAMTSAVAEYLLLADKALDHWRTTSNRPPSEVSAFTTTYFAVRGLQVFGAEEQQKRISERLDQVRTWLSKAPARDTEDRVFRLLALKQIGGGASEIKAAALDLIRSQRADGGWGQLDTMASDAYATGTVLVALHLAGGLPTRDPVYQKGIDYLLRQQLPDGSWHVNSRSRPFQTYFESGFPHGKDQFISLAASGWAATALTLALPEVKVTSARPPELE
jgi:hypothetical protein